MEGVPWQNRLRLSCLFTAQGSSLIELALVLPVFFMLVFGFINFCMIGLDMCSTTYASRAAARYIALRSANSFGYSTDAATDAGAQNLLNQFAIPYPTSTRAVQYTYCGDLTNAAGYHYNCIKVIIHVTYTITVPGYTYSGLQFDTFGEGILVAPH